MDDVDRVLELLYDRGEKFFLADELAATGGLDRQRLDRAIESLRDRGQGVEFSPGHGFRLAGSPKLDSHLIERDLGAARVGRSVICFDEVGSTNDVALDSARQGGTDGLVICAESQRSGRGRQGSQWLSPPRENLLFSALLIYPTGSVSHEALTIATGLAVAEGIEEACGLACRLK